MAETYIDYDAKVQDALRQVVKTVLKETAKDGLMGEHHFYVAFKTQAKGVDIPAHLVSRFPDEMTIVVQHKFWGLEVYDDYFEIGLSFNQKPEHLTIPFDAIVGFVDPSVQFALQFHDENEIPAEPEGVVGEGYEDSAQDTAADTPAGPFASKTAQNDASATENTDAEADDATGGDNIVTLDAFRRK